MIIAVDFDGTLTMEHKFPEVGEPRMWLIKRLIKWKNHGNKLILWSCREDVLPDDNAHFSPRLYLTEAVEWCKSYGLEFDAINKQIDEEKEPNIKVSRKIFADIYIDDRSVVFEESHKNFRIAFEKFGMVEELKNLR